MRFRLFFRGDLPPRRAAKLSQIHALRREFHNQLLELWSAPPLADVLSSSDWHPTPNSGIASNISEVISDIEFIPLVTSKLKLICHLEILFLRPQPAGRILGHGGDIDNRLKTLFDALRVPSAQELGQAGITRQSHWPGQDEWPMMFCLLQDDALVTEVAVKTDRLLVESTKNEIVLIIAVEVRRTQTTSDNFSLIS